jgi:hypothetical protein
MSDPRTRPRDEWPELGGVSEASARGEWGPDGLPPDKEWWQYEPLPIFKARVAALPLIEVQTLTLRIKRVIATVQSQLIRRGKGDAAWWGRAQSAMAKLNERRHLVGIRASELNAAAATRAAARGEAGDSSKRGWRSWWTENRPPLLSDLERAEGLWFSGRRDEGFALLLDVLRRTVVGPSDDSENT